MLGDLAGAAPIASFRNASHWVVRRDAARTLNDLVAHHTALGTLAHYCPDTGGADPCNAVSLKPPARASLTCSARSNASTSDKNSPRCREFKISKHCPVALACPLPGWRTYALYDRRGRKANGRFAEIHGFMHSVGDRPKSGQSRPATRNNPCINLPAENLSVWVAGRRLNRTYGSAATGPPRKKAF
jgi:hypothetical protein